ncbi:MAG: hypothetical protein IPP42_17615 [Saprospiraceae bacterium]|nr:hypothetical protein [Saprospiraceae bacterium]
MKLIILILVILTHFGCKNKNFLGTKLDYEITIDSIYSTYHSLKNVYPSLNVDSTLLFNGMDTNVVLGIKISNFRLDSICLNGAELASRFLYISSISKKISIGQKIIGWSFAIHENSARAKLNCIKKGEVKKFYLIWDMDDFSNDSIIVRFNSRFPQKNLELRLSNLILPLSFSLEL